MAGCLGCDLEVEEPCKAPESFRWKKDWTQIFPNAGKELLEYITSRGSEWTLDICEDSFEDCSKAYTDFMRNFTRQMHILGRTKCEEMKGAKLYGFVSEERRKFKEKKIVQAKARKEQKLAKAAQAQALESPAP